jgi:hypothetical protein
MNEAKYELWMFSGCVAHTLSGFYVERLTIHKSDFNQNYYTFASILLEKFCVVNCLEASLK